MTGLPRAAQIGQIVNLAGGDFIAGHPEALQQGYAFVVKGRGHELNAPRPASVHEFHVGGFVQLQLAQHGQLILFAPSQIFFLIFGALGQTRSQTVGPEGLELDRIGSGVDRGVHQPAGQVQIAVVVDPGFGDDEHMTFIVHFFAAWFERAPRAGFKSINFLRNSSSRLLWASISLSTARVFSAKTPSP